MDVVGERIRVFRRGKEWTLEKLSASCGLSVGFLSQVERGLSSLSIVSLRAISEALGVPLSELFLKEEDPNLLRARRSLQLRKLRTSCIFRLGSTPLHTGI